MEGVQDANVGDAHLIQQGADRSPGKPIALIVLRRPHREEVVSTEIVGFLNGFGVWIHINRMPRYFHR